jgi:hypothetical protein
MNDTYGGKVVWLLVGCLRVTVTESRTASMMLVDLGGEVVAVIFSFGGG